MFDEAGEDVYEVGRIRVWEPGVRLVFSWTGPNFEPGQATEVEVRFEPIGEKTRVTVEHGGWDGLPRDHPVRHGLADDAFARMMAGWWQTQVAAMRTYAGGTHRTPDAKPPERH